MFKSQDYFKIRTKCETVTCTAFIAEVVYLHKHRFSLALSRCLVPSKWCTAVEQRPVSPDKKVLLFKLR